MFTYLAACCGFDLCHKYILYLYLYLYFTVIVSRDARYEWAFGIAPGHAERMATAAAAAVEPVELDAAGEGGGDWGGCRRQCMLQSFDLTPCYFACRALIQQLRRRGHCCCVSSLLLV